MKLSKYQKEMLLAVADAGPEGHGYVRRTDTALRLQGHGLLVTGAWDKGKGGAEVWLTLAGIAYAADLRPPT